MFLSLQMNRQHQIKEMKQSMPSDSRSPLLYLFFLSLPLSPVFESESREEKEKENRKRRERGEMGMNRLQGGERQEGR